MISQRRNCSNVVQVKAAALPFIDCAFDAAMAILTIHHWNDKKMGLDATGNLPPWLAVPDWRRRKIRFVHGIGFPVFLLGFVVCGSFAFRWVLLVSDAAPKLSMKAVGTWGAVQSPPFAAFQLFD